MTDKWMVLGKPFLIVRCYNLDFFGNTNILLIDYKLMHLMGRRYIVFIIIFLLALTFASIPHQSTNSFSSNSRNFVIFNNSNGHPERFSLVPKTYKVNFTEDGLPPDTIWGVNISGNIQFNFKNYINFTEPNGDYAFSVASFNTGLSYLYPSPSNGTLIVAGKNVTIDINYLMGPVNAWTFKGAYVNYTLVQQVQNVTEYGSSSIYINSLNFSEGNFIATFAKNIGSLHFYQTARDIGADEVWPFSSQSPVLLILENETLYGLHQGNITYARFIISQMENPHSNLRLVNISLQSGIFLNTPIGKFLADEITANYEYSNSTLVSNGKLNLFYDQYSGVLLEYQLGKGNFIETISSTNIPMSSSGYTFILNVTPNKAKVELDGINLNVSSGNASAYISPGANKMAFVSVTANGYLPYLKEYLMGSTSGKVYLNISLVASKNSTYTISGHINPVNSSVFVGQYSADVNSTGYYSISLPAGSYILSASDSGYFPLSQKIILNTNLTNQNLSLFREVSPTSVVNLGNITAKGYNTTVSNLREGTGNISLNFNATRNGTLIIEIPYLNIENYSISSILNSKLFVNGSAYTNYTVAVSSSVSGYTIILLVRGLNGDPVLLWDLSPATVSPSGLPVLNNFDLEIVAGIVIVALIAGISYSVLRRKNK